MSFATKGMTRGVQPARTQPGHAGEFNNSWVIDYRPRVSFSGLFEQPTVAVADSQYCVNLNKSGHTKHAHHAARRRPSRRLRRAGLARGPARDPGHLRRHGPWPASSAPTASRRAPRRMRAWQPTWNSRSAAGPAERAGEDRGTDAGPLRRALAGGHADRGARRRPAPAQRVRRDAQGTARDNGRGPTQP